MVFLAKAPTVKKNIKKHVYKRTYDRDYIILIYNVLAFEYFITVLIRASGFMGTQVLGGMPFHFYLAETLSNLLHYFHDH